MSLFGNFKKKMNDKLPLESDETTASFIKHTFHMMKQTLVEDNVRSAFVQVGLQYDIETSQYVLRFDEDLLRQSPMFTSLWQRDSSLEKLLQRRRNAEFGWVNKMICPDWGTKE
jgi:hypothetical protein